MYFGAVYVYFPDEFDEWSMEQLIKIELRELDIKEWSFTKLSGFHKCNEEDLERFGYGTVDGLGTQNEDDAIS